MIVIAFASCNLMTQSKSEPSIVHGPESKPSNFETNDSSFLKLKIKGNKFEIQFLKNVSVAENINDLDAFFQKNQKLINREKIIVTGLDTTRNNKDFRDLLAKYGISKVRMNEE